MPTLVIVESPTKAKTISKFLGKGFIVESSYGHVRDLPKSKMGVDIEGGTFKPSYRVPTDKTKQVKKLKDLAKRCERIIFATDEDREGEAISWHLIEILGIDPKAAERIVFHEITKHAILEALKTPRNLDINLVDAQQARRVLDRLVGYELSPLLWRKIMRGLSAGRVQSVSMRLIVEREREIEAFEPQEYWTLKADFLPDGIDNTIEGKLHSIDGKVLKKFDLTQKKQLDEIVAALDGATYTITNIASKEVKRNAAAPFTTSKLQQEANTRLGFSSKNTMRIAQQLYEGITVPKEGQVGLITYMRTDSTNMSQKFLTETNDFVQKTYGKEYSLTAPNTFKTKSKGAQEAHEAIRPTDPSRTPDSIKNALTSEQYRLYSLIWRKAVATQMSPARLNKSTIDITANNHTFRTSGQTMVFPGWLTLYPERVNETVLPEVKQDQSVNCKKLSPNQHFTEPPARFNDASLVKILEEHGIGRPSTYAPTIATLEYRGYVERNDNKRLQPQTIAFLVNDLLVEHFPNIVDVSFTANVERQFDTIAEGKLEWPKMISEFYGPFHALIVEKDKSIDRGDISHMREIGIDPKTKKPVYSRIGPYGPFVQLGSKDDEEKPTFASMEKDQSVDSITLEEAMVLLSLPRLVGQDKDGNDIMASKGRFGPYLQSDKKYYSLKELSPYTITLDEALVVIKDKKEADAKKQIHSFDDGNILVLNGPYGEYIKQGKNNFKIPKDTEVEKLTLELCKAIIVEQKKNPKKGRQRKTNAKKKKK